MKYFILNIKTNNQSAVDHWLGEKKMAPIFYGRLTIQDIIDNEKVNEYVIKKAGYPINTKGYKDARLFINTFKNINSEAIIFSIGNKDIYIFKQIAELAELKGNLDKNYDKELVKCFKIQVLKKIKIKDCPLVLATIKSNTYIGRGTFRCLDDEKHFGNIKSIEYLTNNKPVVVKDFFEYLQCLSSIEFETLIAKFLEEKGFFVAAYKGGFLKDYDLICRNLSQQDIILSEKKIKPKQNIAVQIKLRLQTTDLNNEAETDYYFCLTKDSAVQKNNVFDWHYIENNIGRNTKDWLNKSLYWMDIKKNHHQ